MPVGMHVACQRVGGATYYQAGPARRLDTEAVAARALDLMAAMLNPKTDSRTTRAVNDSHLRLIGSRYLSDSTWADHSWSPSRRTSPAYSKTSARIAPGPLERSTRTGIRLILLSKQVVHLVISAPVVG